jgi:hypothetical protein
MLATSQAQCYEGIEREFLGMRLLRATALLTVLFAGPAFAQGIQPPAPTDPGKSPGQIESEKSSDQAYKKSLRNIPDKPPADPWGGARAIDGSSSSASTPQPKKTRATN